MDLGKTSHSSFFISSGIFPLKIVKKKKTSHLVDLFYCKLTYYGYFNLILKLSYFFIDQLIYFKCSIRDPSRNI